MKALKTQKALFLSIAVLFLIGAAQGAFAHDYFNDWAGHWVRGAPGTTHQAWEFPQGPGLTVNGNPYHEPQITITNGSYLTGQERVMGPGGTLINVWHIGEGGGEVNLYISNNPVTNLFKFIYLQVTADKSLTAPPVVMAPGTVTVTPGDIKMYDPTAWGTYSWKIKIEPNPDFEQLTLRFAGNTNIEEIVVDTSCVPEPSSLAALGMSGIFTGLLALKRRRR